MGSPVARWCVLLLCAAPVVAQEDPQAEDAAIAIPRTEEAAALARRVTGSVRGFHFSLGRSGVPGAIASFAVWRDDQAGGELRASWNAERDAIAVWYEGELPAAAADSLRTFGWRALNLALASSWETKDVYGIDSGDGFVLDPLDTEVSRSSRESFHRDHIAHDLLSWRHIIRSPDGEQREECTYRADGDTAYVASSRESRTREGAPARTVECDFRYLRQEGHAFPKRISVRETSGGATTSWRLELKRVEFRATAPKEPPESELREAREVIERIRRDHYFLGDRAESFEALYDVSFEGQVIGRVRCTWGEPAWAIIARFEGQVPAGCGEKFRANNEGRSIESFMEGFAEEWLWQAVFLGFGSAGSDYMDRSRRTEDGVVLLQTDRTGIRPREMTITLIAPDGHVKSLERRYRNGNSERVDYDQRKADGTFLKKGAVFTVRTAEGHEWSRSISYVYKRQEGLLFPKRVESALTWEGARPGSSGDVLLELVELTFRGVHAPEGGGDAQ